MSAITFKDTYHYYHRGVESRPSWAYNDARQKIAKKWASFLKAMPNTSNVVFQDAIFEGLGGSTARFAAFPTDPTVSGAGSKTKHPTGGAKSWETWFDVHYTIELFFVPTGEAGAGGGHEGRSIDEVNLAISQAKVV